MHFQERLISHGKERLKSYGCGKNAPYIAWYLQPTKTTYTIGIERTVKKSLEITNILVSKFVFLKDSNKT